MVTSPRFSDHLTHLRLIQTVALQAADAGRCVADQLKLRPGGFTAGRHTISLIPNSRLFVVATGKAAPAMCKAAVEVLGSRIDQGIAAVPRWTSDHAPAELTYIPAGHPHPDEGSLIGGRAVETMLAETAEGDVLLALVSGGGSAMLEIPRGGISLPELQALNGLLLRSGTPIEEINIVRSALSRIKSGGLARLAAPARTVALILSDVVEDRLSSIASGPTALRSPRPRLARQILEKHNLWTQVPRVIREALTVTPTTPAPTPRPINVLIGSNRVALDAAMQAASGLGFAPRVIRRRMTGEARIVGGLFGSRLTVTTPPACLLMGGETTVTVRGQGLGGRNQELALSAALTLDGSFGKALMALATDGVDGPTDAAGAVVTSETASRAREAGLHPEAALVDNDAYPTLDRLGALIRIGPTGTNVNDLVVGLAYSG
jgi:hydroxypyruvate reductase